jgi:hypothetical protein
MSAKKYFAKMKSIGSELAAIGKPLDDDELLWYVLSGLGNSYNNLTTAVRANPGTTLLDLFDQVQAYDNMHKSDEPDSFSSSANVSRRTENRQPPRGSDHGR